MVKVIALSLLFTLSVAALSACSTFDAANHPDGKWHAPSTTRTAIALSITAAALIGLDVWLATRNPPSATISRSVLDWSLDHPVIPFAIGVVMGHILWPQPYTPSSSSSK